MFDVLIKGGLVVDGTGHAPLVQDVAVKDGRIVAVGASIKGEALETVEANGLLVTPGFVDPHTHYDAQVAWDSELLPSSAHGVTTVVTGNCGVGVAPVRRGQEDWVMHVLEVIEEVPTSAMKAGIDWSWETFGEYLDALDRKSYAVNIAAQVPHTALRAYVMGERGHKDEQPSAAELTEIRKIVREAIEAGAVGVSTSRCSIHQTEYGPLPGTRATDEEIFSIAEAIRDGGGGVFQMIPSGLTGVIEGDGKTNMIVGMLPDPHRLSDEVNRMRALHQKTGVTCTFSFGIRPTMGDDYQRSIEAVAKAHEAGEKVFPQFAPRPLSVLISLEVQHIFEDRPTYRALRDLPVAERARKMAEPAIRAAILSEQDLAPDTDDPLQLFGRTIAKQLQNVYALTDGNDYEPDFSTSMTALAKASGRDPQEIFYDLLVDDGRCGMLIWFADHSEGNAGRKAGFLGNPGYVVGLSDGGAHSKLICDASFQTYLLSRWGKGRAKSDRLPIEVLVNRITKLPADIFGLTDRGVIAEGKRADINVIDFDRLAVLLPRLLNDFPSGAQRFVQGAQGYAMTMVNGVVTRRNDKDTGARPGRVIRNPLSAAHRGGVGAHLSA